MKSWENFIGKEISFYGCDNHTFKIGDETGTYVFEALEDESDGYRSYLGSVQLHDKQLKSLIFFQTPIATIKIIDNTNDRVKEVYQFVDVDPAHHNHVWLEFGTDNADDYYPIFTFYYEAYYDKLVRLLSD
jgi:hypothetical protein